MTANGGWLRQARKGHRTPASRQVCCLDPAWTPWTPCLDCKKLRNMLSTGTVPSTVAQPDIRVLSGHDRSRFGWSDRNVASTVPRFTVWREHQAQRNLELADSGSSEDRCSSKPNCSRRGIVIHTNSFSNPSYRICAQQGPFPGSCLVRCF